MKQPDSLDSGTQMDIARYRLQTAKEDLDTAKLTYESEQFRAANNRAYYSIFHSICAVLAKEGISFKRHKDTIAFLIKTIFIQKFFPKSLAERL